MKGSYIFLADGFEDTEAVGTIDVLRRGGVEIKTVSINDYNTVTSSRGIPMVADLTWTAFVKEQGRADGETGKEDLMVFPGGMPGTKNLAADEPLMSMMKRHFAEGGTVAAICAAPGLVAGQLDGVEGRRFTCFDGFEDNLLAKGAKYCKVPAVADGNLITGRGAGCAMDFGLAILGELTDEATVRNVRHGLMLD